MASYSRLSFTNDDERLLIEFVREHPCLWNAKCVLYANANARKEFWKEIAQRLNKTETDCMRKWRFMRDYYLNKLKHKSKIYSKPNSKYQTLSFLNEVVPRQKRIHPPDYQTEFVTFKINQPSDEVETTLAMDSPIAASEELDNDDNNDNDTHSDDNNVDQKQVKIITSDDLFRAPALTEENEELQQKHVELIEEIVAEDLPKAEPPEKDDYSLDDIFIIEETAATAAAADLNVIAMAASHFDCAEEMTPADSEAPIASAILSANNGGETRQPSSASSSKDKIIDLFFQSMAATVKTFPANMVARAKQKVFNAISELELELHSGGK